MLHNGLRHSHAVPKCKVESSELYISVWRAGAVGGCKPERYHSVVLFRGGSSSFNFLCPPPSFFCLHANSWVNIIFSYNKNKE